MLTIVVTFLASKSFEYYAIDYQSLKFGSLHYIFRFFFNFHHLMHLLPKHVTRTIFFKAYPCTRLASSTRSYLHFSITHDRSPLNIRTTKNINVSLHDFPSILLFLYYNFSLVKSECLVV